MNKFCFGVIYNGRLWEKELRVSALKVYNHSLEDRAIGNMSFRFRVISILDRLGPGHHGAKSRGRMVSFHTWISVYNRNKKNYNMIHHIIIGGFIDVYIVVRFVWF